MKIVDGLAFHSYDNKTVIVDTLNSGKIYMLEGTAHIIWSLLIQENMSMQSACSKYTDIFTDIDSDTLIGDFNNLISLLEINKIIEESKEEYLNNRKRL